MNLSWLTPTNVQAMLILFVAILVIGFGVSIFHRLPPRDQVATVAPINCNGCSADDTKIVTTFPVSPKPAESVVVAPTETAPSESVVVTPTETDPAEPVVVAPTETAPSEPVVVTPTETAPSEPVVVTPTETAPSEPVVVTPAETAPSEPVAVTPDETDITVEPLFLIEPAEHTTIEPEHTTIEPKIENSTEASEATEPAPSIENVERLSQVVVIRTKFVDPDKPSTPKSVDPDKPSTPKSVDPDKPSTPKSTDKCPEVCPEKIAKENRSKINYLHERLKSLEDKMKEIMDMSKKQSEHTTTPQDNPKTQLNSTNKCVDCHKK